MIYRLALLLAAVTSALLPGCKKCDHRSNHEESEEGKGELLEPDVFDDAQVAADYAIMKGGYTLGISNYADVAAQCDAMDDLMARAQRGHLESRRAIFAICLLPDEILTADRRYNNTGGRSFPISFELSHCIRTFEDDYPNRDSLTGLPRWRAYARWKLQEMGVEVEGEVAAPPEVVGLPKGTPEPLENPAFGEFADPEVARYFAVIEGTLPETKPKISKDAVIFPLLWLMRAGSIEAERALYSILLLPAEGLNEDGKQKSGMTSTTVRHLARHDLQAMPYQGNLGAEFFTGWRAYARWKLDTLGVEVEGEQAPPPEVVGLPAGFPAALDNPEFGEFASPEVARLFALATAMVARRSEHRGRRPSPEVIDPLFQLRRAGSVEARRALYSTFLLTSDWPEQNGREINWVAAASMRKLMRFDTETPARSGASKRALLAEWQAYARRELATLGVDTTGH